MRRKKTIAEPVWLIWEGDDFPRKIHSDSVVFYLTEHIYLDQDEIAKKALAKQLRLEGVADSLGEAFRLIDLGWVSKGGYYFEDDDERFPVYCELDDELYDWDATFVEVPFVS